MIFFEHLVFGPVLTRFFYIICISGDTLLAAVAKVRQGLQMTRFQSGEACA